MDKLLIAGAKGFAKELFSAILQFDKKPEMVFYDDVSNDLPPLLFGKYRIIKSESEVSAYFQNDGKEFALGVGHPSVRKRLYEKLVELGGVPRTIVSPSSIVGLVANVVGEGSTILANAVLESDNIVGNGVLVHVGALISHDVRVGSFCEISPGAKLLGNVQVGSLCQIGTNSVVLPGIQIEDNAVVGAGAVVSRNVANGVTVVGVPASPLVK